MRFFSYTPKNKGFTLMEVLVAVGIVAVLASIVLVNISQARMKSRDAKRVNELQQVQLALRLFKDSYGHYPSAAETVPPNSPAKCAHDTSLLPGGCMEILVSKNLLPSLPKGPVSTDVYFYDNWCVGVSGSDYANGKYFRMWTTGESYINKTGINWWSNPAIIGITTCANPSQ